MKQNIAELQDSVRKAKVVFMYVCNTKIYICLNFNIDT